VIDVSVVLEGAFKDDFVTRNKLFGFLYRIPAVKTLSAFTSPYHIVTILYTKCRDDSGQSTGTLGTIH